MPKGMDLPSLNRGRARHPLFGRYRTRPRKGQPEKDLWFDTNFKPGFWDDAMNGPVAFRVRKDLIKMIDGLLKELASKPSKAA